MQENLEKILCNFELCNISPPVKLHFLTFPCRSDNDALMHELELKNLQFVVWVSVRKSVVQNIMAINSFQVVFLVQ